MIFAHKTSQEKYKIEVFSESKMSKPKFSTTYYETDISLKDASMEFKDDRVFLINGRKEDSINLKVFSRDYDSSRNIVYEDDDFIIKEWTFVEFSYPYLLIIKGSLEIIIYSFLDNVFYYEKLNCPIFMKCAKP